MKVTFEKQREITSAFIDSQTKLGIAQSVLLIQDNLTEDFEMMECDGIRFLELNVFWVFTKSKIHFYRRPDWREIITAKTFPINNAGFRTNVNTIFTDKDGQPILVANQEACVLDKEKHRPVKLTTLPYPKEDFPEPVYTEPFEKFPVEAANYEEVYQYQIRSQNIDMSHHMNNNEYIKLALNVFTTEFLENNEIKDLEVHYTGESKEGQTLKILKAQVASATYIQITESDRVVFEMKISF